MRNLVTSAMLLAAITFVPSLSWAQTYEGTFDHHEIETGHVRLVCPGANFPDTTKESTDEVVFISLPGGISCPALSMNGGTFTVTHPIGKLRGTFPLGTTDAVPVAVLEPADFLASANMSATMVDTDGGAEHRFRSVVEVQSQNPATCTPARAEQEDRTSVPATFFHNITATCLVTQLRTIPSTVQRENGRIVAFQAELVSTLDVVLDHGQLSRGGIYLVKVSSRYSFTILDNALKITTTDSAPSPLAIEEQGLLGVDIDVDLKSEEKGKVVLTASYLDESGAEIILATEESASIAAGERTLSLLLPPFEVPGVPIDVKAKLIAVDGASDGALLAADNGIVAVADDYMIDHVELVQVVQDAANSVPLVAGKAAYLRVFPKRKSLGGKTSGIPLRVEIGTPGTSTYRVAVADGSNQVIGHSPDRGLFDYHSYDIPLPADILPEGNLQIRAIINPQGTAPETKLDNNELTVNLNLKKTRGMVIKYIPVCEGRPGILPVCATTGTPGAAEFTEAVFPIAQGGVSFSRLGTKDLIITYELRPIDNLFVLLNRLQRMYLATVAASGGLIDFDQMVALVPEEMIDLGGVAAARFAGGLGRVSIVADYSAIGPGVGTGTLAHEIGHNLGLRHAVTASCGPGVPNKAQDPNTDWPFATSNIQEYGAMPLRGSLVVGDPVTDPDVAFDLMSYCDNDWISPFHYRKIYNSEFLPTDNPGVPARRFADGDYSLISGVVSRDGSQGEIDPLYRLNGSSEVSIPDPEGDYCLVFTSAGGEDLGQHCFRVSFQASEGPTQLFQQMFSAIVPIPVGTARLSLQWLGTELAARTVTTGAPTVQINAPTGGENWQDGQEQVLRWSGSDADGDGLLYSVFYSNPGTAMWTPLVIDIAETELIIDPSQLDGGAGVEFRVIATDGFNSGEAMVGPINVVQNPRIEVAGSATVNLGQTILGRSIAGSVPLSNPGTGPVTVTAITSNSQQFVVTGPGVPLEIAAGATREIGVLYTPSAEQTEIASLSVMSNATDQPQLMVSLEAAGTDGQTPLLRLDKAAVGILDIEVGSMGRSSVTLHNDSLVDLEMDWDTDGASFTVSGQDAAFTIAPLGSATLQVDFLPAVAGDFTGTLTLHSNDASKGEVLIPLIGSSVAAPVGAVPSFAAASIVSAASFVGGAFAPDMWTTLYGNELADDLVVFENVLATSLGGTRITVTDSLGTEKAGKIQFVSPGAMNFVIPGGLAEGPATVTVSNSSGLEASAQIELGAVAPGLFSINSNGEGPAAATWLRVDGDGVQTSGLTFGSGAPIPNAPLALGPESDQVYLSFFGTGFRGQSSVSAKVGGVDVPVAAAVAQGQFDGLDQAVIGPLPRELEGRGEMTVEFLFDGVAANAVTVAIE